ncbi:MAG: anhydro-N-acetylmuramic acid kinase [Gammaproteobacteria bacterium]|jgi:anhydro-N-acetylmuramic acid kinase|nr:anhydro-N-acetylmuramic acid kinase [Gammaproteobacteria bacterium]
MLYVGLMSGTSMDGIDAVLLDIRDAGFRLLASHSHPWPEGVIKRLRALAVPGEDHVDLLGETDALVGEAMAGAALALLERSGFGTAEVAAVGSHGQTIRHRPDATPPFTLQIGDPHRIAEITGIATVADFRRRDIAAGGQGAPLVPAFHAAAFADAAGRESRAVLNVGGIANVTLLPADAASPVLGFDTGPGNCLMDGWARREIGTPFDRDGALAARGRVVPAVLDAMLADDYFSRPPPKSTGPEHFSDDWLARHLEGRSVAPQDVQATLAALTARSVALAVVCHAPTTRRLIACGGGVHNAQLMTLLCRELAPIPVETSEAYGLHPDWVEAAAFAWLAHRTLAGAPGNLPSVTGARHPVVLGAIHPGG